MIYYHCVGYIHMVYLIIYIHLDILILYTSVIVFSFRFDDWSYYHANGEVYYNQPPCKSL